MQCLCHGRWDPVGLLRKKEKKRLSTTFLMHEALLSAMKVQQPVARFLHYFF
jgi:hypothetical protein